MIEIAICDDNEVFNEELEKILLSFCDVIKEEMGIDTYTSGALLLEKVDKYDLIFLDIEMRGLNGVQVGSRIREIDKTMSKQIVFVSSKTNYAMQLFDIRPINFLVKPVSKPKVLEVLKETVNLMGHTRNIFCYEKRREKNYVMIDKIIYFESQKRKIVIATDDGKNTFYGSIDQIAKDLHDRGFIVIHRAYMVNCTRIKVIRRNEIVMDDDSILPLSGRRREEVIAIMSQL